MVVLKWEEVQHERGFTVLRAVVFGGWLVLAEYDTSYHSTCEGLHVKAGMVPAFTFVPDKHHVWGTENVMETALHTLLGKEK